MQLGSCPLPYSWPYLCFTLLLDRKLPNLLWSSVRRQLGHLTVLDLHDVVFVSVLPICYTWLLHGLAVPPEVRTNYINIVDTILTESDLFLISEKQIRQGIQAKVEYDITPQKVSLKRAEARRIQSPLMHP